MRIQPSLKLGTSRETRTAFRRSREARRDRRRAPGAASSKRPVCHLIIKSLRAAPRLTLDQRTPRRPRLRFWKRYGVPENVKRAAACLPAAGEDHVYMPWRDARAGAFEAAFDGTFHTSSRGETMAARARVRDLKLKRRGSPQKGAAFGGQLTPANVARSLILRRGFLACALYN